VNGIVFAIIYLISPRHGVIGTRVAGVRRRRALLASRG
jgi:manganese transport system permease protein